MAKHLSPLDPPFTDKVAAILERYPQRGGYLLSLFRTFANSVRFLEKGVPNLLDAGSPLALRHREIVILRVTARLNCAYEWGVHVAAFAKQAGLSEAQVAATRTGAEAAWTAEEAVLLSVVDQLCERGTVSDAVREQFAEAFTVEQQLEVLALCGTYHTISYVANVARLPNEPFGAAFPDPA
jgi:alkylhydroperoxidase family enzyme